MLIIWPIKKLRRFLQRVEGYCFRRRIRNKIVHNKRIVFLADYPQGWNSFRTVYEKLKANKDLEVILLAWIGWPYPGNDKTFWREIDANAIISTPNNIVSLEALNADIIFRQTPYNPEYPKGYSAKNICKIAKLCYIPYSYEPSPLKHLVIEYNENFFPYVYAIFCDNNSSKEFCVEKANRSYFTSDILCFDYGFPRFDIDSVESTRKEYKCFMWIPRWSLDAKGNDATSFFSYYDNLVSLFEKSTDTSLIIRPHPSMFNNFVKEGAMTEKEVEDLRANIKEKDNIFLDEGADYIISFNKSDVLIADWSSLTIEYFMTGKPLVYCGSKGEFNKETQCMLQLFYTVKNWSGLEETVLQLIEGSDPLFEKRQALISEIKGRDLDNNSTNRIVQACLNDF